jgi:hypothetical protein
MSEVRWSWLGRAADGKRSGRLGLGSAAFALALVAVARLLTLPDPSAVQPTPAVPDEMSLSQAWPSSRIVERAGVLPDGAPVDPVLFVDVDTMVGTALTTDGRSTRLVISTGNTFREIRRLPSDLYPEFSGVSVVADTLVWAETTASTSSGVRTRLWRADWRTPHAAPVLITKDTGAVVFMHSRYDLVVADGLVHWVSADGARTQVRSVPIGGGAVKVRRVPGVFAFAGWPWLAAISMSQAGPVDMVNIVTGQRMTVPSGPTEQANCGSVWCQVTVIGATGPVRLDVMRTDGTGRRRIGGSGAAGVIGEPALLDRFVGVTVDEGSLSSVGAPTLRQQLQVYDLRSDRTMLVDPSVDQVHAGGRMLWWSRDAERGSSWYVLDTSTLTP